MSLSNVNFSASTMMAMLDGSNAPENTVTKKVDANLYNPKLSESKSADGIYTSILRFVPFVGDPNGTSYVKKKITWLRRSPQDRSARPIDNPWSIGEFNNPINDLFFSLKNSGNANYANIAKACISTKDMSYALVQVVKDDNHKEWEGRIMVMGFSKQIMDIIADEEKTTEVHTGVSPFHAFGGRLFYFQITQGPKYPTYEKSRFFDNPQMASGIRYLDSNNAWQVTSPNNVSEQVCKDLISYLTTNSPDLSEYAYKPWDEDTRKFVDETLMAIQSYATTGGVGMNNPAEVAFAHKASDAVFTGVSQAPMSNITAQFAQPVQQPTFTAQAAGQPTTFAANPGVTPVNQAPQTAPMFGGSFAPQQPAQPTVSGVTVPNVQPTAQVSQQADQNNPFGNIDDVLNAM